MTRILKLAVGCCWLLLVGCGGPTEPISQTPATGPVTARSGEIHASVGPVSVSLNPGWNAVGFQAASLTSLNSNSSIAGMATYDNGYQVGSLTMADVNSGAGTRRGFWLFATGATSLTYSGSDPGSVSLDLKSGWNLVAFPSLSNVPGSQLICKKSGQSVTLTSYVLPQFYEIGAGANTPVDVSAGGSCKPGKAYWVFALEAVSLSYGSPAPTPSPTSIFFNGNNSAVSPGGTSPSFTLTSSYVITEMWTYHYQFSGSLGTLSLKDASGTTYGPWQASGATSSPQPKWYWTVTPNVTLPAGTYTVIDSDPASWSKDSGSGGKGIVQVYGYPVGVTPSPTPTPTASPTPAASPTPTPGGSPTSGSFTLTTVTAVPSGNPTGNVDNVGFWDCTYSPGSFTGHQWHMTGGVKVRDWTVKLTHSAPPNQIRPGDTWPITGTCTVLTNAPPAADNWDAYIVANHGAYIFPNNDGYVHVYGANPAGTSASQVATGKCPAGGQDFNLRVDTNLAFAFGVQHVYRYKWNP